MEILKSELMFFSCFGLNSCNIFAISSSVSMHRVVTITDLNVYRQHLSSIYKNIITFQQFLRGVYLQASSNLTGGPYRAHCSINRVPRFRFNNIYKVIRCPQKDNRIISENTKLHVREIVS